jgi:hypothetical protein
MSGIGLLLSGNLPILERQQKLNGLDLRINMAET